MKIHHDTGTNLTEGIDSALRMIMERYHISRLNARKLLGEALIRFTVQDEIAEQCDWQMECKEQEAQG